jgi:hypothetical protein
MVVSYRFVGIVILILVIVVYIYGTIKNEQFESNPSPAPAAVQKASLPILVPREVSPSGPNPPNARNPVKLPNVFPQILPNDPMDETYGSQDIQDNMRYPERSFRPGLINNANKHMINSEVASNSILDSIQPIQPFKPELVQNGGMFEGVGADDTHSNNNYASF